jgi:hypothetical protein
MQRYVGVVTEMAFSAILESSFRDFFILSKYSTKNIV